MAHKEGLIDGDVFQPDDAFAGLYLQNAIDEQDRIAVREGIEYSFYVDQKHPRIWSAKGTSLQVHGVARPAPEVPREGSAHFGLRLQLLLCPLFHVHQEVRKTLRGREVSRFSIDGVGSRIGWE